MSTFNNAKWVGLSQFTKVILQIMALIIFSRLLDPLEYGIMAMATVISNFALIIRDLGTGAAVIQRKVISNDLLSSIFWLNIIMGLLVMVAIIICAPLLSEFFKESKLCNVLLLLSVTFPLASAAIVHQANLEREFQFAKVCSIEIASSLISFLIGIVCAIKNYGVYSLVVLTISQAMISTLGMWFASKWRPQFKVNWSEIQEVYSFSGNLTLFNMVNYFSRNSDGIIIGRFFSSAILGAYSLAYRIMLFPVQSLTSVISRSLYPVISRMQDDVNSINHVYMRTLAFISTLTLPLMMGLWSIRNEFVMEILGAKWISVVGILSWLAPTGYIQSLVSTTGTILMACGRANILFYLGVAAAVLQVSAFLIGAQFNITTLSMLYFYSNLINSFIAMYFVMKCINGSLMILIKKLVPSIVSTGVMLIYVKIILKIKEIWLWSDLVTLIVSILGGMTIYTFIYIVFFKQSIRENFPSTLSTKIIKS